MQNYKKGNVKTVRNVKKIVVINGSPRRDGNTVRMTSAVVSGIRSLLPEVEILEFNLYDLNYTGCRNCFSCKVRNSSNYGKCVIKDDLASVLDRICKADGLIIWSPVYLMDVNGQTKSFLERLCFSLGSYEKGYRSLAPARIPVVTVYTMNNLPESAPHGTLDNADIFLGHIFSSPLRVCAYNTYQFDDYSKYVVETFSESEKAAYRDSHIAEEMHTAFTVGREMAFLILKNDRGETDLKCPRFT